MTFDVPILLVTPLVQTTVSVRLVSDALQHTRLCNNVLTKLGVVQQSAANGPQESFKEEESLNSSF